MKKTLTALLLSLSLMSSVAFAATSRSSTANIQQGNVLTSAAVSLSQNWFSGYDITAFYLNSGLEYFFIDRLAFGVNFGIAHRGTSYSSSYTDLTFGPAATLYFWQQQEIATYFDTDLNINILDRSDDAIQWNLGLGVDYFLTPAVAFGPKVQYGHVFGLNNYPSSNQLNFLAAFRISL